MANPEDTGPDSRNAKKPTPTELKKELEKLINLILNEDDYAVQELNKAICILSSLKEKNAIENETTDEVIRVVSSLRELKIKESVPKEFKRPMSGEIMGEPVVVASGQVIIFKGICTEGFIQGQNELARSQTHMVIGEGGAISSREVIVHPGGAYDHIHALDTYQILPPQERISGFDPAHHKYNRFTDEEVEELVQAVERHGTGR